MPASRVMTSAAVDLESAFDEAGRAVLPPGDGPCDAAVVFVGNAHGPLVGLERCEEGLAAAGARRVAVVQVEGLLCREGEHGQLPALAVAALRGLDALPLEIDGVAGRERELGEEIAARVGHLDARDLLLVVVDAHAPDARALAQGLSHCRPAAVLGVGVEGPAGGPAGLRLDGRACDDAALVLRLRAPRKVGCALAAAGRVVSSHCVTRSRGHWLHGLDGAAALAAWLDAAGGLLAEHPERARRSVLVALPDGAGVPDPARARAVVGFDSQHGAITLPVAVAEGDRVGFVVRDPLAAREALGKAASRLSPGGAAAFGLAVACSGRGASLLGETGVESAYLDAAFGGGPWVGLRGSFEIGASARSGGPAAPVPDVLTHAAALARLD